jgi:hypothetical protein
MVMKPMRRQIGGAIKSINVTFPGGTTWSFGHAIVCAGSVALIDRQRVRAGLAGEVVLLLSAVAAAALSFHRLPVSG